MRCAEMEMWTLCMCEMKNTAYSPLSQMLTSPVHPSPFAEQRDLALSTFSTDYGCAQRARSGDCDRGRRRNHVNGYVFTGGDESLSVFPSRLPLHGSASQSCSGTVGHRYGNTHFGHRERPHR